MSDIDTAQLNLESILTARQELTLQEKNQIKEALDSLDAKIEYCRKSMGKKPRETLEEIVTRIRELERENSTKSQSKADDRIFMREMNNLRQKKKELAEFSKATEELDNYRARRASLSSELKEKGNTLNELFLGIRKVRTASKLGCSTSEVFEQRFTVPEDKIARVIGKGGTMLKQIEIDCKVSIEADKNITGLLRVMGTEATIERAREKITEIVNSTTEEISLKEETIVCMLVRKGELMQELQREYFVRMDISRVKRVCKITGSCIAVDSVKKAIVSLDSARSQLSIERNVLPFIMKQGGQLIHSIEDDYKVQIDIPRDENNVTILGFREDVEKVSTILSSLIEENKEVEEVMKVNDRNIIIGCLIGEGGQIARSLQKELGVTLRTDKGENGNIENLILRGTYTKVISAKERILQLLSEFIAQTVVVEVPSECLPMILGKKGASIKAIRDAAPNVTIHVDGTLISIQSTSEVDRNAACATIDAIVAKNYSRSVGMDQDTIIALKSSKCTELRTKISDLDLTMDIDKDEEIVKLRGYRDKVEAGVAVLEDFKSRNYVHTLDLIDEDCTSLSVPVVSSSSSDVTGPARNSGVISTMRSVEAEFGVEIFVAHKEGRVLIRGPKEAVQKAVEAINSILKGNLSRGTIVVLVDPQIFPALIGKAGANAKKFESDHGVKVEIIRPRNVVRLRGPPSNPELLLKAKKSLLRFANDVQISVSVPVPDKYTVKGNEEDASTLAKFMSEVASVFDVEIMKTGDAVTIRGSIGLVEDAKKHLRDLCIGVSEVVIQLTQAQAKFLVSRFPNLSKKIQDSRKVQLSLDAATDSCIRISGALDAVSKARQDVMHELDTLFPSEFLSVAMTEKCLRDIGSIQTCDEISEMTGAVLKTDRLLSCVQISGAPDAALSAVKVLRQRIQEWNDSHATIKIEEYIIASLVGKAGANINALRKACGVRGININKEKLVVEIDGEGCERAQVSFAKDLVKQRVDELLSSNWEVKMREDWMPMFIGKEGVNIKKLRTETSCSIEVDSKSMAVKVSGDPKGVQAAKQRIVDFISDEAVKSSFVEIPVPNSYFNALIGIKFATAQEIQQSSGTRLAFDRARDIVVIRGRPEDCANATKLIMSMLEKEGFSPPAIHDIATDETEAEYVTESTVAQPQSKSTTENVNNQSQQPQQTLKPPPGATPAMIAQFNINQHQQQGLSKSSYRRLRRRLRASDKADIDTEDEDEQEGDEEQDTADMVVPPSSGVSDEKYQEVNALSSIDGVAAGIGRAFIQSGFVAPDPSPTTPPFILPPGASAHSPTVFHNILASSPPPGFPAPNSTSNSPPPPGDLSAAASSLRPAPVVSALQYVPLAPPGFFEQEPSHASLQYGAIPPTPLPPLASPNASLRLCKPEFCPSPSTHATAFSNQSSVNIKQLANPVIVKSSNDHGGSDNNGSVAWSTAQQPGYYKSKSGLSIRL